MTTRRLDDIISTTPPGLDGTYSGSCVACLQGTDACVAVVGDVDWHAACLMTVGLPIEEAKAVIFASGFPILAPDFSPVFYAICTKCAGRMRGLKPAVPWTEIPGVIQPVEKRTP
jgi:hypothetical protein